MGTTDDALLVVEHVLVVASASISCIGCALVLLTYKSFSAPNYVSRRIVASIGIAGLATAIGFLMSIVVNGNGAHYKQTESLCYLQAITLQYFGLASYLWIACFAFHLYQIIVKRNEYPEQLLWLYRSIGWGVPGIALLYAIVRQLTGHIGVGPADRRWCWLANDYAAESDSDVTNWHSTGALQQFGLFYVPLALVFIFNAVVYGRMIRFLQNDPLAKRFQQKVALYLAIAFGCSMWGVSNRLFQFYSPHHTPSRVLCLIESVVEPLQPLVTLVAYSPTTTRARLNAFKQAFVNWKVRIAKQLRQCCRWWKRVDDDALLSSDDDEERTMQLLLDDDKDEQLNQRDRRTSSSDSSVSQFLFPYATSPR